MDCKLSLQRQCEYCGQLLANASALYRHIRCVHKITLESRDPSCLVSLFKTKIEKCKRKRKSNIKNTTISNTRCLLNSFPTERVGFGCYNYRITKYEESDHASPANRLLEVEFPINSTSEIKEWKEKYEQKNFIFLRKNSVHKWRKDSVLYKEVFHCGHYLRQSTRKNDTEALVNNKSRAAHQQRNTNCRFRIQLLVEKEDSSKLIARVRLFNDHNHNLGVAASLMHRPVSNYVKEKFLYLFNRGYKPKAAMQLHVNDLHDEYGDDAYNKIADRFYNPDNFWVYRLHADIFRKQYGAQYGLHMLQNLTEKVTQFKHAKLEIIDEQMNYVISIVTPFMLRVHESILQSSEIIFMDSTGTVDRLNCKLFVLLTNSFAGGLPVGIIISTVESSDAIKCGLQMIQELISDQSFGGRGIQGPLVFMTDHSAAEKAALKEVFPEAKQLICQFHILHAMWRYIWSQEHGVKAADRNTLFLMIKSAICEKSLDVFTKKIEKLLENELLKSYPLVLQHFEYKLATKEEWALCYRTNLITRGQHTNNICESSMRIIKEVILQRTKAYSPVQLFDIMTTEFEQYYSDKLQAICNGQIPCYLRTKLRQLFKKSEGLVYDKTNATVYNPSSKRIYDVDVTLGLCSCAEGDGGKLCEHLFWAVQETELIHHVMIPSNGVEKRKLFKIATGMELNNNDPWCQPLLPETEINFCVENMERSNSMDVCTKTSYTNNVDDDLIDSHSMDDIYMSISDKNHAEDDLIDVHLTDNAYKSISDNDANDDLIDSVDDAIVDHMNEEDIENLNKTCENIKFMAISYPSLTKAIRNFISQYAKLQTVSAIEAAFETFGKYHNGGRSRSHKIAVSRAAIARPVKLRRSSTNVGRTPKCLRGGDHNFARSPTSVIMPKCSRKKIK